MIDRENFREALAWTDLMHQRARFNRSLFWPARKLRPHFCAALAAGGADEVRFDVGEPDTRTSTAVIVM